MQRYLKSTLRPLIALARKSGLTVATVPGQRHWRAGVELLWRPFDENVRRIPISMVEYEDKRFQFFIDSRTDWIQEHHLGGKFYAAEELEYIRAAFTSSTFVDIGANVGNHSVFAAGVIGAKRVIAIEPNPVAYRVLLCNVALNDFSTTIEHLPIGLSDLDGKAAVFTPDPEINLGGTKLTDDPRGSVQLRRGDDVLEGVDDIGFIKIDVEGLEMQVLSGLISTIARCRPPMMVEVDDKNRGDFERWCEQYRYLIDRETRPYNNMANLFVSPAPKIG